MKKPVVALIGRTNVGKSSLYNRLTESLGAIVSSWAGTTRDVNRSTVTWRGQEFELWDTGGVDVVDDEQLQERVIAQATNAMDTADVVLFVIDGQIGLLPQDRELMRELHKRDIDVVVVVNKIDNDTAEYSIAKNIHQMPLKTKIFVSAKNGRDTDILLDTILERIEDVAVGSGPADEVSVAIVGRPNVGKSSLLNSILGEETVVVADKAHTTRDTNDIPYTYKDKHFILIDTAGLRRRTKVGKKWGDRRLGSIEKQSARGSIQAIERADVVLLVLEAQKRVTAQDKKIIQVCQERGKGLIIVVNKWDLIEEKTPTTINEFAHFFDISVPFLRWAPMIFVSAVDGLRVRDTLDMVSRVGDNFERQIPEEGLQGVLGMIRSKYKPKQSATRKYRKKIAKLKNIEQVGVRPPHFYLQTSHPKEIPQAIPRIMERELRDRFDFEGVQIRIEIGE
jgi:GTP-binding protein